MQEGFSLKNIWQNMTKGQKRALVFGFVMILILVVILSFLVSIPMEEIVAGGDDNNMETEGTTTEITNDEYGNTVTTTTDSNGNTTTIVYGYEGNRVVAKSMGASSDPDVATYLDEDGNTIIRTVVTNSDGTKTVTEIKRDAYGNVNTTNPNMISTYFPHQVMREHEDGESTFRLYLSLDEKTKVINAVTEGCNEEEDKALVKEYIESVPLDLSDYTITYEEASEDVGCP